MKAKLTTITESVQAKAAFLLATSSIVAAIAGSAIPPYGKWGGFA